jgi:hypothetical protein
LKAIIEAGLDVDDRKNVIVWDPDAPCGTQKAYIHFSGGDRNQFAPMTAGAGKLVHSYRAAYFAEPFPLSRGVTGCHDISNFKSPQHEVLWKVARYGSSCSDSS